jgi:hypothetical protein
MVALARLLELAAGSSAALELALNETPSHSWAAMSSVKQVRMVITVSFFPLFRQGHVYSALSVI